MWRIPFFQYFHKIFDIPIRHQEKLHFPYEIVFALGIK